ncbi:MAG: aminopeptidase P N-terminal domain-containing protein, partial [Bacteroidaceae bacterium]|nr:aminopeptidase P N-terminal domain-containing protein [Bacteroidaceae bacterium]
MLFDKQTYEARRATLRQQVGSGLILLPGNSDTPVNYPSNVYKFRQDSTFLYYFGLQREDLAAVIDADSGEEWIFGDDIDIDDIVWFGQVESVAEMAAACGVAKSAPMGQLSALVAKALACKRQIHF